MWFVYYFKYNKKDYFMKEVPQSGIFLTPDVCVCFIGSEEDCDKYRISKQYGGSL